MLNLLTSDIFIGEFKPRPQKCCKSIALYVLIVALRENQLLRQDLLQNERTVIYDIVFLSGICSSLLYITVVSVRTRRFITAL